MTVGADPARARRAMTALQPVGVGRNRWPVMAPRRAEVLARRQPARHRGKARPDELRDRASLSAAVLRRVTLRRWACRAAIPSAGQARPAPPVRRSSPGTAILRTRRSMRTRAEPRRIWAAVRGQGSADPLP